MAQSRQGHVQTWRSQPIPNDWDTKYNYELSARLVTALRTKPKQVPPSLMQLLRPSKEGPMREPVKKTG